MSKCPPQVFVVLVQDTGASYRSTACFFMAIIHIKKLGVVTLLVSPQSAQIFSGYDTQQMPGQLYDGLNSG